MRTKTVFQSDEVCHIWAKQTQTEGRNSCGNIFFRDNKIYSYGHHFCMGNIIKPGIVLTTSRSYSKSTSKHLGKMFYAVNHLDQISVPFPDCELLEDVNSETNASYWTREISSLFDIVNNTRKREHTRTNAKAKISALVKDIDRYLEVTKQSMTKGVKSERKETDRIEFLAIYKLTKGEIGQIDYDITLKRLAANTERRKKNAQKKAIENAMEKLSAWQSNKEYSHYRDLSILEKVYLRMDSEGFVETSKGARVSAKAAKRLYKMIIAGKDVKGFDIDGYTVLGVNGTLKVGCHEIDRAEIDRFAKSQNW